MDLESEFSAHESVENNEGIDNTAAAGNFENIGEPKVQNNGSCVEENSGPDGSFPEMKGERSEISGSMSLPAVVINHDSSPSSSLTRKGSGLKKWRRIRREANKVGVSSVQPGTMATDETLNSAGHLSKRVQIYPEEKQRNESPISSTNAMLRNLDNFAVLDDSGLEMRPSFAAGTDLDGREDQKSKSSTIESVPRVRGETFAAVGFPHDKRRIRSLSGKNLTHSVQRSMQGKGRIDTGKRSKGEKVKIVKENSHSSTESDSRSYNLMFTHGMHFIENGIRTEKSTVHDGENGDEGQGIEHRISNDLQDDFHKTEKGGYEDASTEDVGAGSSWEVKDEMSQNNGSSEDIGPLAEDVFALQSVQQMLEKEIQKVSQIGKDLAIADLGQDLSSELIEPANKNVEKETEDLFKQKVEAEVECLAISGTVLSLRAAVNQVNILEEPKTLPSKRKTVLNQIQDAVKKDALLEKEAENLETFCDYTASADESLKLQTRVCKYMSYFFVQLVLLVVILVIFIFQESPKYIGVVPT